MAVWMAKKRGLTNFSALVSHVLVPPAISAILRSLGNRVQGFLGPGHVCTVVGYEEYEPLVSEFDVPIVITGFELGRHARRHPLRTVRQLKADVAHVENQYSRVVSWRSESANRANYFRKTSSKSATADRRGIGNIPMSGLSAERSLQRF